MSELHISATLSLPLEVVTQRTALLARTGAGKTNTAVVLVEELLAAQQQVVIVDPPGAWWGLRSSQDGTQPGFPIVVLGGDHGDLPLDSHAGAAIADLVVDEGISAVLDLSEFSGGDTSRFVTAFAERLYTRKSTKRDPMLLVVEEADEVAPQSTMQGQERMLGAMERLVKRGRMRGIGTLVITQRSASLNKNVLSQTELLIMLQTTAPQDIKAVDDWIKRHGDQEHRAQLLSEIATLPVGTAFVWSPAWLRIFQKVQVRRRTTFDSSATPKPGERVVAPKTLADIDLGALRTRLAATVEKAQADDPNVLRQRIAELERSLRAKPAAPAPSMVERIIERVEVPVLDQALVTQLLEASDSLRSAAMRVIDAADGVTRALVSERPLPAAAAPKREIAQNRKLTHAPDTQASPPDSKLSGPERKLLTALWRYPDGLSKARLAILTGYAVGGGGFANLIGSLRSRGLIGPERDMLRISQAGSDALGDVDPLPTGDALVTYWEGKLGKAERLILRALVNAWPRSLSREQVADATGYVASGGGFANALGRLRTLELISGGRDLKAADVFLDGVGAR